MRYVECDNCGERDDWSYTADEGPFFPDGIVLQFRTDNGGRAFETVGELCGDCKGELLRALPGLKESLDKRP